MYKIDDEFRPRGRVYMKATHEERHNDRHQPSSSVHSDNAIALKSSLKKGPPITTSLDDRRIQFQHEVKHEKTVEALITEYPPGTDYQPPGNRSYSNERSQKLYSSSSHSPHRAIVTGGPSTSSEVVHYSTGTDDNSGVDVTDHVQSMQAVTRNKHNSTEVLGSSFESKKLSQRGNDGQRRITTHIVRKVTTLSRAEENANAQNLVQTAHNKTTEIGYMSTQAIEPKRPKVFQSLFFEAKLDKI